MQLNLNTKFMQDFTVILLKLLVLISSLKNIVYWVYPLLNTGFFTFHYPVIPYLNLLPNFFPALICIASFSGSLYIFFNNSRVVLSVVLLFCGCVNIYLQPSDYLGLHHDMYLSGIAFIALGYYFLNPNKSRYGIILAITSATYLLSGIYKINPDFLDGSMTLDIINRADRYFYGDLFIFLFNKFSVPLSIFAIVVEIIEPFILIFGSLLWKKVSVLITLPFHIGIALTGTGTVYNLIYPILFWYLIFFENKFEENIKIHYLHFIAMILLLVISVIYIFFLLSLLPGHVEGFIEKYL